MEVLYPRCAGLDVHKTTVVACVRLMEGGPPQSEIRTFGTTTGDLLNLSAWLSEKQCTHVVMEATGVYWRPVWRILSDGEFQLALANAAHVKNVPGRKTDVKDCAWLADLMAHGLIKGSFVPDTQTQEMRTLLRTRKQLVRERSSHVQRLQKTLESANVKLDSVISDITGKSGRAMIEAMIVGETDPEKLAGLADRLIKASRQELKQALQGRIVRRHRFMLQLQLRQIAAINATIAILDQEVEDNLAPFREGVELLKTIPGVDAVSAQGILAEIGCDIGQFPTDDHLISWAGICPRSDESAGKRRSTRMKKGAPWLKITLIECAWAAKRKKGSYLQAQFNRICARRGPKKAIGAVAASVLRAAYHMLKKSSLPRPRRRLLYPPQQDRLHPTPPQKPEKPRLRGAAGPYRRMTDRP
jgi:transposase